ncbi:MAG: hypothetical protein AAGA53_03975 [Pseudomonadota bacterium]
MTEVVILISSLLFADIQNDASANAHAEALIREADRYGGIMNYDSATPNPEQPGTVYLTIMIDNQAQAFAETVRNLEGVYASYVKPGVERP